jgi:hypothetical protein
MFHHHKQLLAMRLIRIMERSSNLNMWSHLSSITELRSNKRHHSSNGTDTHNNRTLNSMTEIPSVFLELSHNKNNSL